MTVAEMLPAALRNRRTGKTEIEDVRVEIREDASEREALFITLVLPGRRMVLTPGRSTTSGRFGE